MNDQSRSNAMMRRIAANVAKLPAPAAKAATSQIPIVFTAGSDAVKSGLVASLNRPGGNVTGVSLLGMSLDAKRLQLLHELAPRALTIGVIANPKSTALSEFAEMKAAADANGQRLVVLEAETDADLEATFDRGRSMHCWSRPIHFTKDAAIKS